MTTPPRRKPAPRVLTEEEHEHAGRAVEVRVDFTGETPQVEVVFDRMIGSGEARGWTLPAFDTAAAPLCAETGETGEEAAGAVPG